MRKLFETFSSRHKDRYRDYRKVLMRKLNILMSFRIILERLRLRRKGHNKDENKRQEESVRE